MKYISIIIPILNEKNYIENCLISVLKSDYSKEKMEILLIDGGSDDGTLEIIQKFQEEFSFIKLLRNPKKIVPISMNIGIKEAKGDYIIRLDAHADYPVNYFSKLIEWHQKLDADNVGTTIVTKVKNKTLKANSIKEILSHKFGVGDSDFRTGIKDVKEVDTVPFGCYKKEVFEKYGLYDERLVRNQDIELNKRIINGGGKIYLIPDVQCTYYARENFKALAKNNFSNGYWNILTAYYTKTLNSLSLRHFIPLIFLLMLVLPLIFSFFIPKFIYVTLLSLGSYLALVIMTSLKVREENNSFYYLVGSFFTLHFSYGFGSLVGIFFLLGNYIKGDR